MYEYINTKKTVNSNTWFTKQNILAGLCELKKVTNNVCVGAVMKERLYVTQMLTIVHLRIHEYLMWYFYAHFSL